MKIGTDLDATIFSLLFIPRKAVIKKMRLMRGQGYQFIIITRRPNYFFWFTNLLLILYRVPFDDLFCVGFTRGANERKFQVIKKEKIQIFIDSNKNVVAFMEANLVPAVTNLDVF